MAENTLEPLAILNGDNQALDLMGFFFFFFFFL